MTTNSNDAEIISSTENTGVTSDDLLTTDVNDLATETYETASLGLHTFETPERVLKFISFRLERLSQ